LRPQHVAVVCALLLVGASSQNQVPGAIPVAGSVIQASPERLDFSPQPVGSGSQPKTVTLTNSANANVTILDITASGIDFTQTNTCQRSLAPGANCRVAVTFKPVVTGVRIGVLVVSDSTTSPRFVVLTGTGE